MEFDKENSFISFEKTNKWFHLEFSGYCNKDKQDQFQKDLETLLKNSELFTAYYNSQTMEELISPIQEIKNFKLFCHHQAFNHTHYEFLTFILAKLSKENKSIYFMTYIEKNFMTLWRKFYFSVFLEEILENPSSLTFLSRKMEYIKTPFASKKMNSLLEEVYPFKNLKKLVFVNGNLDDVNEYPEHLRMVNKIMINNEKSLEKIVLFFRSMWIHQSEYLPIFETFDSMGKYENLKCFRIALGGVEQPNPQGISKIKDILNNAFEKTNYFCNLQEFGIFIANTFLNQEILNDLTKASLKKLHQLKVYHFLTQTNFHGYHKAEFNEILKTIFETKSEILREISLAFCADQGKSHFLTDFDLDVFMNLIKGNKWCLLKFNLYYDVNDKVDRNKLQEFLITLMKYQEFILHSKIMILRRGKDILKTYGFKKILKNFLKLKNRMILMAKGLSLLQKKYRKEILNEILENFIF